MTHGKDDFHFGNVAGHSCKSPAASAAGLICLYFSFAKLERGCGDLSWRLIRRPPYWSGRRRGYHSANNKGIPYGFVYLDIGAKTKEAWSFTLSHEVLELLADPDTALTVAGPRPKHVPGTVYYDS